MVVKHTLSEVLHCTTLCLNYVNFPNFPAGATRFLPSFAYFPNNKSQEVGRAVSQTVTSPADFGGNPVFQRI